MSQIELRKRRWKTRDNNNPNNEQLPTISYQRNKIKNKKSKCV